jgi:ubiquinone/menaquinone biosynthesis C-methylase UbiE
METTLLSDGRFWNRMADRYARQPIADPDAYERKLGLTARFLRPDMRVVEFGCGTGGTALRHAARVTQVDGVDISARMLEIAEARRQEAGVGNVRFMQGDLLGFAPGQVRYDGVFAMSLLHLVADRDAALAKIRSLLGPGDLFVSSTTCIGDTARLVKWIAPIGKALGLFPTLRVFTTAELCASVTAAGFDIVEQWSPGPGKATFIVARAR